MFALPLPLPLPLLFPGCRQCLQGRRRARLPTGEEDGVDGNDDNDDCIENETGKVIIMRMMTMMITAGIMMMMVSTMTIMMIMRMIYI